METAATLSDRYTIHLDDKGGHLQTPTCAYMAPMSNEELDKLYEALKFRESQSDTKEPAVPNHTDHKAVKEFLKLCMRTPDKDVADKFRRFIELFNDIWAHQTVGLNHLWALAEEAQPKTHHATAKAGSDANGGLV